MDPSEADQANQQMVDQMIVEGDLWSPALIAAFRATPRHRFLDRVFVHQRKHNRWREVLTRDPGPDELRLIYSDQALITHLSKTGDEAPVPISSSSQPSLMAQMLEDLRPQPGQRVLEIGAGTGYNAALLAHVVGPGQVLTIDVDKSVLSEAWDHLRHFPERNVRLQHADGRLGYSSGAPYDRIMVTAATSDLEPAWLEQLVPRGLLLAPLALAPGLAYVVRGTALDGLFHGCLTRAAYFMPLRAEGESGTSDLAGLPLEGLKAVRAPWAGWFERRRNRTGWLSFAQALAFFGWLDGRVVDYRHLPDGETAFGVGDGNGAVCWFGQSHWKVPDRDGRDLGRQLWRVFLEAGGPRPPEFRLTAAPPGRELPEPRSRFEREGRRCRQRWELIEDRERPMWY